MSQIICIGSSSKDIFFPTKDGLAFDTPEDVTAQKKIAFELGAKYHIEDRFESLGGCAVNVACGLRRLGVLSSCYTVVGNDSDGQWIKKELKKEGVEINLIKEVDFVTGLSAIIVDKQSGERIIFSNQEANEHLKIEPSEILNYSWISVTDPSGNWREILSEVARVIDQNQAKLSFNPRGRNIFEDAKAVYDFAGKAEILFVNKDEAIEIISQINQGEDLKQKMNEEIFLLNELKKSGARVVVITDGKRGAWGYDGKEIFHVEAPELKAVDATGAGDAFSSGFLAGYISGKSLEESLKMGIANGSSVVLYYGGIEGLLTNDNIEELTEKIKIKKLS